MSILGKKMIDQGNVPSLVAQSRFDSRLRNGVASIGAICVVAEVAYVDQVGVEKSRLA